MPVCLGRGMSKPLEKSIFTPSQIHLPAVQAFDCGTDPWELEVSDWIKGQGVLDDMQRSSGCEVWRYGNEELGFVGFGSLSEPSWSYPGKGDPRPNLIPMVGIQSRFRGMPPGPKQERYAWQIMDDLQSEAKRHLERAPVLVLYVHPDNQRAIHFYEEYGFEWYTRTYTDNATHVVYKTMALVFGSGT